MVVVDRAALEASDLGLASEVWIHDPPPDAVQILRDSGFLIRGSTSASDVFEVTSFLTVRWSYQVFAAFGVLIGVVLVVAQVLVLDARRRSRQASSVIGRRMGLRLGEEATAIFVELVGAVRPRRLHRLRGGGRDRASRHRASRHACETSSRPRGWWSI